MLFHSLSTCVRCLHCFLTVFHSNFNFIYIYNPGRILRIKRISTPRVWADKKYLSKEVGKQSSELRTNRIVRLHSMKGGVWLYITSQWEVWDYIQWRVVCDFTSHHNEKRETTFNEGWCVTVHYITMRSVRLHSMKGGVLCVTLHHITMRSVRLYSMKGGVWLYITWLWEVWDYTQWRVVCDFTSNHNEKCETTVNEGWCVTLHHITMRSVRLQLMKGGVWLYITSQWEVWDYSQWRVVCYFTSHHNEKCEATFNEGWCVTYLTSQWEVWDYIPCKVVCYLTSHHNEKCETTFNEGWQNAL